MSAVKPLPRSWWPIAEGVDAGRFSYRAATAAWRVDGVTVTPGWHSEPLHGQGVRQLVAMKRGGLIEVPKAPAPPEPDSWLYVVELGDDIVKPGRAENLAVRFKQHRLGAARYDRELGRTWESTRPVGTRPNERALLGWCDDQPGSARRGGREYFTGLSFDAVVEAAREFDDTAHEPPPPPEGPTIDADGFTTVRLTADGAARLAQNRERERLAEMLAQIRPEPAP